MKTHESRADVLYCCSASLLIASIYSTVISYVNFIILIIAKELSSNKTVILAIMTMIVCLEGGSLLVDSARSTGGGFCDREEQISKH